MSSMENEVIARIQRYIERTGVNYPDGSPYQLCIPDLCVLLNLAEKDSAYAIILAFEYGRAKGERSARAAQKQEVVPV